MSSHLMLVGYEQEKLLGKSALNLYRVLRSLRGRNPATLGVVKELSWLAKATDLSYGTASRAVARLRECGALRTSRVDAKGLGSNLSFHVRGRVVRGDLWLPKRLAVWCQERLNHGGDRKSLRFQDAVYSKQNDPNKSKDVNELQFQDAVSLVHNYSYALDTSFSFGERHGLRPVQEFSVRKLRPMPKWPTDIQRALDRGSISLVEAELLLPRPDDPPTPPFEFTSSLHQNVSAGARRLLQHRKDNPRPSRVGPPPELPPLCPVRRVKLGYEELEAGLSAKVMVSRVLQGYEEASHGVFGAGRQQSWFRGTRNLETHARLLQAARWLQDNGIAPGAWAHWQLAFAKSKGMKAWGPARIFVVSRMEKQGQFFFDDYDGPQGIREEWTDDNREQLYRREEAMARWENKTPNVLNLIGTAWYRTMRESEIARGMTDPLAGYMKV